MGSGKDKVDKLTKLILIFQNESLEYRKNRVGSDDIIDDAYEYMMKNFASKRAVKAKGNSTLLRKYPVLQRIFRRIILTVNLRFWRKFMDILSEYFMGDYVSEKEQLKSVNEIISKVIPTYGQFKNKSGWNYEFTKCEPAKEKESKSTSTLSMIAFSMQVLRSGISDLNHKNVCNDIKSHYLNLSKEDKQKFDKIFEEATTLLFEEYKTQGKFTSSTYGQNDPFTRVWTEHLAGTYHGDTIPPKPKSEDYVEKIFKSLYENREMLNFTDDKEKIIESTHIFPLLKVVQLYEMLSGSDKTSIEKTYVNNVKSQLMNCLFTHLSLVNIENSNFDTAELVFSLEGVLLLDENRDNFDKNLLKRVFSVIKERQAISMYWRPLKPFVMNEKGLALLPLSVEIAMSLIRICRMLGKYGELLFTEYLDVFNSYTEWLKTRMNIVSCKNECTEEECKKSNCFNSSIREKKFYGWCSEHVHQPDVIHLWETSQVVIYLVNFNSMLQKHIAQRSFKYANFSYNNDWDVNRLQIEEHGYDKKGWDNWLESEPLKQDKFRVYKDLGESFIERGSQLKSMLLYGPPGTGKSTIAEEIAKAKDWPLVTITPSDFIANGADQVEARAKIIFKVLEEQEHIVVLFDEIDRLILDRDSKEYHSQSDIFQFMTPSMLVKIKDLRTKERIIFIIATNYEERIDMAIKRAGRIDEKYLVLPPDKEGRMTLFNKFIKGEIPELDTDEYQKLLIDKTALFTFTEFKQLAKTLKKSKSIWLEDGKGITKELISLIGRPAISIETCAAKILNTDMVQKPYKEFFALVYLKAENFNNLSDFSGAEKKCITQVLSLLMQKNRDTCIDELRRIKDEMKEKLSDYINDKMIDKIIDLLEISEGSEG